jgi:hypothetical protein
MDALEVSGSVAMKCDRVLQLIHDASPYAGDFPVKWQRVIDGLQQAYDLLALYREKVA